MQYPNLCVSACCGGMSFYCFMFNKNGQNISEFCGFKHVVVVCHSITSCLTRTEWNYPNCLSICGGMSLYCYTCNRQLCGFKHVVVVPHSITSCLTRTERKYPNCVGLCMLWWYMSLNCYTCVTGTNNKTIRIVLVYAGCGGGMS